LIVAVRCKAWTAVFYGRKTKPCQVSENGGNSENQDYNQADEAQRFLFEQADYYIKQHKAPFFSYISVYRI
jgi:hypothetical protein